VPVLLGSGYPRESSGWILAKASNWTKILLCSSLSIMGQQANPCLPGNWLLNCVHRCDVTFDMPSK